MRTTSNMFIANLALSDLIMMCTHVSNEPICLKFGVLNLLKKSKLRSFYNESTFFPSFSRYIQSSNLSVYNSGTP